MFGHMIYYSNDLCVLKSDGEVYRIEGKPEDLSDDIESESPVEFELVGNRAVNLKRVYFGPDMKAVLRGNKKIEKYKDNMFGPYIDDCEGAIRDLYIGILDLPYNADKTYIENVLQEIGATCYAPKAHNHQTHKVKLNIGSKKCEFESDLIHIGLSYPITRLKNQLEVDKAEAEFSKYYNEIDKKYREIVNKNHNIRDIQRSLYSCNVLYRLYYEYKYKDKSYDYLKFKMA